MWRGEVRGEASFLPWDIVLTRCAGTREAVERQVLRCFDSLFTGTLATLLCFLSEMWNSGSVGS